MVTEDYPEAFPGHDGGAWAPAPVEIIAEWPAGCFVENLLFSTNGNVFVSLHSHHRIDVVEAATGHVSIFVELPAPVAGMAFDDDGTLWAVGSVIGESPGYVWRIFPDGMLQPWLTIEGASFLNGCTRLGRSLLVCESLSGRVLAVDMDAARWHVWLSDDRLKPKTAGMPGANGIKVRNGNAYVSVTDARTIFFVPVGPDNQPGPLEPFASRLLADDFAFDPAGNMYVATHPVQTVVRIDADGSRSTIAGPREGAVGSTACAIGPPDADGQVLFVTTNGGMSAPYAGQLQLAKLLRIRIDG